MDNKTRYRLEIVLGYVDRVAQTLDRAGSPEAFIADYDLQYSVAHSISQIAELLTQVSHSDAVSFEQLLDVIPYRDIRRMRDKIQHHYGSIDSDTVWGIASQNVPELGQAIKELMDAAS